MKRTFITVITVSLILSSNYTNGKTIKSPECEFIGHWIFSKTETIASFENSEMTEEEVHKFSSILKAQEIVISDSLYSVYPDRGKPIRTPFSLIAPPDDKGCFMLQFENTRIPLDIQKHTFCIRAGKLLLPAPKGAKEVYNRKL
ncbi:hypothetical protein [Alteromonas macleodii]|uniref:Uncharacterized protein n=1 Tax=Alteromonas macleodii TaxID=28108 RepID=A0A6T9XW57_ALTMA|nr:hypothetical protein [Alteromonas macleodii]CAB9492587.1 conserved protein of unknown function [Alteromonas macleodii]